MAASKNAIEKELKAIQDVITALSNLDPETINRVLKYSMEHLGISIALPGVRTSLAPASESRSNDLSNSIIPNLTDIKSLKEAKQPSSGIEMVALVGFYLSEHAPESDRKSEFGVKECEKYFKQAGFKLPPTMKATLNNAKNAGYLDSAGHGKYKLNPVGYNLVAHNLTSKKK